MSEINIIELIEKNPITKLSPIYNNKFINKIKENFDDFEKNLLASSFYCYLNYDKNHDFVIDLDDVWKFLGFFKKCDSKNLLEKSFKENIDYKYISKEDLLLNSQQQKKGRGGHNSKKIFLTIKCFKSMCLKANTKKADEIHEYYMKLEDILQEIINEESNELKLQLIQKDNALLIKDNEIIQKDNALLIKDNEILQNKILSEREKELLREKTLLDQFNENMQCIYYGRVDNTSTKGEKLIKFGHSNNLRMRIDQHKKTYSNFLLLNVFKVSNKIYIENCIKQHEILKKYRRNILIDNINYTELLTTEKITYEELESLIRDIITENEYNIENYNKMIEHTKELQSTIYSQRDEIELLTKQNRDLENKLKQHTTIPYEEKKFNNVKFTNFSHFYLYAFHCNNNRYKCGICRVGEVDFREEIYKKSDPSGKMVYKVLVSYPFIDKVLTFLLGERLVKISKDTYDGGLQDIKLIYDICDKFEKYIANGNNALEDILDRISNINITTTYDDVEPDIPAIRKSKRAVDQVDINTGQVVASYSSIEEAGRKNNLTSGTAIGIALRNKKVCINYLWRYSNISAEDQYTDQPVIKVCCNTGEKQHFPNIAAAAVDCNISAPGLRNRILTKVHVNDHHWIFNKNSTHYT